MIPWTLSPSLSEDFLATERGCTRARGPFDLLWLVVAVPLIFNSASESDTSNDWLILSFLYGFNTVSKRFWNNWERTQNYSLILKYI